MAVRSLLNASVDRHVEECEAVTMLKRRSILAKKIMILGTLISGEQKIPDLCIFDIPRPC